MEIFLVGVVLVTGLLLGRLLATRTGMPDAAAYVLLGVLAGLLPGVSAVQLSPDVVLLLFLPPLLYYAAFFSDPRETMRNIVAVVGQAVGLVLVTAMAVAVALLLVFPDVGWAAAIALGAAVAPPDPVAAGAVLQRVGAPRRLVTILEAEGLMNDGVALTLFAIAVAAVGAPTSGGDVLGLLAVEVLGGVGFGLVIGVVIAAVRRRVKDTTSQVLLSVGTPYLAFLPPQLLHSSGVLATVAAAMWLGTRGRGLVEPTSRLPTETFWRVLNTLLVAVLFLLVGVQVPTIVGVVSHYPVWLLVLAGVAVVVAAVGVRLAWVMLVVPLAAKLPVREEFEVGMPWQERLALGWCGPRGAVSLAIALSIPLTTASGEPFPRRDLLLFLTVVVVLATLVAQTVPLPMLLRRLGLEPGEDERTEGLRARRAVVDAGLRELDELAACDEPDPPGVEALRQMLELRRDALREQLVSRRVESGDNDVSSLRLRLIEVERRALRKLHDDGEITRATLVAISQELDLDENHLRKR